jgi:glutathionylspermidine synthase
MKRVPSVPRFEWWNKVSATGLTYYAPDGVLYWDESVCYEFSPAEIDVLKSAARELQSLCEQAAQTIVERSLWNQLGVDEPLGAAIARSWRRRDQALLGRFDFAWDGAGPPKLLEYNADTPMALIEASQTQLQWQRETAPAAGQWNGLHEALVAAWREVPYSRIHFTGFLQAPEDAATLRYLAQTATAAGKETVLLPIDRLGWHRRLNCFVDAERKPVERIFKLYPWDWLWQEGFTRHPDWPCELFIEPLWKLLWNSKSILAILWKLFPDHPNLGIYIPVSSALKNP